MDELQVFNNPKFGEVRTIEENGKVLFCGKDVAFALGYKDSTNAIKQHCRGVVKRHLTDNLGRKQESNFIPEGDIYRLAAKSELPGADEFERWIFDEVLPSIHNHGAYATPQTLEKALLDPDFGIRLFQKLKEEQEACRDAELNQAHMAIEIAHMEPKVAYFNACVEKNLNLSLRDTAKLFGVEERQFIQYLLAHKFLYRSKGGKLLPYATRPAGQLFEVKELYDAQAGWFGVQTLVTPRGRETFRLLLQGGAPSCLWGRNGGLSEPKEMTAEDERYDQLYYERYARNEARRKKKK